MRDEGFTQDRDDRTWATSTRNDVPVTQLSTVVLFGVGRQKYAFWVESGIDPCRHTSIQGIMAPQLGDTEETEAHSNGVCRRNHTHV